MTLQQEACEKILCLPDDKIRLVIVFMDEMIRQLSALRQNDLYEKQQAYSAMTEMKRVSKYPEDFDYRKVREEAIFEKYGHID